MGAPRGAAAALAVALHVNTLENEIVWDDRAAVLMNQDLRPETPLRRCSATTSGARI